MNILVHYETEEGPQIYTVSATTKEEIDRALKSFRDRTGLTENQYTIQLVSTSV